MTRQASRRLSVLLSMLLTLLPVFTAARTDDILEKIVSGWMEEVSQMNQALPAGAEEASITQREAFQIAAETLIRMEYETAETLAEYEVSFDLSSQFSQEAWVLNLKPRDDAAHAQELYSVEVNAFDGHLVGFAVGSAYNYDTEMPEDFYTTESSVARNAPIDAEDVSTLAEQLQRKALATYSASPASLMDGGDFVQPSDEDLSELEAIETALTAAVSEGGFTVTELSDYRAIYSITNDGAGMRVWTVRLFPLELAAHPYTKVVIDAGTADILSFVITEPTVEGERGIQDEEEYVTLVAYWKAHKYSDFTLPSEDESNGAPKESEVQQDEALRNAVDMILRLSGLPMEALYAFTLDFNFHNSGSRFEGVGLSQRAWDIHFSNWETEVIPRLINVCIDAETGFITDIGFFRSQFAYPTVPFGEQLLAREDLMNVVDGWKEMNGGEELPITLTPIGELDINYMDSSEQYGLPGANSCPQEAALCVALDAITRLEKIPAESFTDTVPIVRFKSYREDKLRYVIDIQGEKRYIVEVESPSGRLQRVTVSNGTDAIE